MSQEYLLPEHEYLRWPCCCPSAALAVWDMDDQCEVPGGISELPEPLQSHTLQGEKRPRQPRCISTCQSVIHFWLSFVVSVWISCAGIRWQQQISQARRRLSRWIERRWRMVSSKSASNSGSSDSIMTLRRTSSRSWRIQCRWLLHAVCSALDLASAASSYNTTLLNGT